MYHIVLSLVSVSFILYTAYVSWQIGYLGIWQAGLASIGSVQILLDVIISCGLICVWIYQDASRRGRNPWFWIIATGFLGSISPLCYLLMREWLGNKPAI